MDQQLVIKLSEETRAPIGLVESPPLLYSNFKRLFPKETFSDKAVAVEVESFGYGVFEWSWAPTDLLYTRSSDDVGLTKHSDGIWRPTFVERAATEEEIAQRTKLKAESVRIDRDQLLRGTDYTQLPDCVFPSEVVSKFAVYRQSLRDIPKQEGFPWKVIYPTMP